MAWSDIQAAFEFRGPCSADALSVLRVIAYNTRDNGFAFCGTEYLAHMIGRRSRKTAQTAVNELVSRGYIIRKSGRLAGHRNHYYLNIPGAKYTGEVEDVDKSVVYTPRKPKVGKVEPQNVGKVEQNVGKADASGCVSGDAVNRKVNNSNKDSVRGNQPKGVLYPPLQLKPTPPIGSDEFRRHAVQICYEQGASAEKAAEFYAQHQSENWTILEKMPLEVAARLFVDSWKSSDMRGWSSEALRRFREKC